MSRNLIPAALALVLVPLTVAGVLWLMAEPPTMLPFPKPRHRVAVAVDGAMRAEMTGVRWTSDMLFVPSTLKSSKAPSYPRPPYGYIRTLPGGSGLKLSEPIPEGSECFYLPDGARPSQRLFILRYMTFEATASDGWTVTVTVQEDPFGEGSVVDFHGDAEAARLLAGPIARILAHPSHPHDSPEDRAALVAFFAPTPGMNAITGVAPIPTPIPAPSPAGQPSTGLDLGTGSR